MLGNIRCATLYTQYSFRGGVSIGFKAFLFGVLYFSSISATSTSSGAFSKNLGFATISINNKLNGSMDNSASEVQEITQA